MLVDKNLPNSHKVIVGEAEPGDYRVPIIDYKTNALVRIRYVHHMIHAGVSFETHHTLTGKDDGTWLTIYMQTPNSEKEIHLFPQWQSSVAAYFRIREYPDVTGNTGTTGNVYNRNRRSINTSAVRDNATAPAVNKVMTDVTIADRTPATAGVTGGLVIYREYDGTGKKISGGNKDDDERILKKDTPYVFELESDAASGILALQLWWYELTPKG